MSNRSKLTLSTAMAALISGPALAGAMQEPEPEAVIVAPTPASPATPDWTGFYGGVQLGYANVTGDAPVDGDGALGGVTLGYDYDFGRWVMGGALDYDFADIDVGGGNSLQNVARVKLRGGYDTGGGLIYATAGGAQAEVDPLGTDSGYFVGGGYEHIVNDNMTLGVETLWHDFSDFDDSGIDVEATTVQLRGTFRF